MSRHTKEKRQKQKQKIIEQVKAENIVYDVLFLLRTEQLDTKPNMGEFLKKYVKAIRGYDSYKVQFYPSFDFRVIKIMVNFVDGHELMCECEESQDQKRYFYYYQSEELELRKKDYDCIGRFFDFLRRFKFVFNMAEPVRRTPGNNEELDDIASTDTDESK